MPLQRALWGGTVLLAVPRPVIALANRLDDSWHDSVTNRARRCRPSLSLPPPLSTAVHVGGFRRLGALPAWSDGGRVGVISQIPS